MGKYFFKLFGSLYYFLQKIIQHSKIHMKNEDELYLEQMYGEHDDRGYYEWNRESPESIYVDEKENAIDSLETALSLLDRKDNLKWKWVAFALHHSLYSFSIAALENGNYESVLVKGSENSFCVKKGNEAWKKVSIIPFYIGKFKTSAYRINWKPLLEFPKTGSKKGGNINREKLIGFWTALARVQDGYFWMGRMGGVKPLKLNDEELKGIIWLTDAVRNDLMHLIPKGYSISSLDVISSSLIFINAIEHLALNSFSIMFLEYEKSIKRIKICIEEIRRRLTEENDDIIKYLESTKT